MATNSDILAALNEIIDKLDGLCNCLDIEVHPPQITIPGGGGFEPEQPPITEGDPPPSGAFPQDTSIVDRKCKAANMIVDNITAYTDTLSRTIDFDNVVILDFSSLGALLSSLSAALGTFLNTLSAQMAGWLSSVAAFIMGGSFSQADIDDLVTKLKANQTDLVCALYNATSTSQAKTDFLNVLTLSIQQETYLGYFLNNTALNMLFVAQLGSESQLENYVSTIDCALCICPEISIFLGTLQSSTPLELQSENSGGLDYVSVDFNYDTGYCGPEVTINSIIVLSGGPLSTGSDYAFRLNDQIGTNLYSSDTIPNSAINNVGQMILTSDNGPFTVRVDYS